jgi:hypothetical protein
VQRWRGAPLSKGPFEIRTMKKTADMSDWCDEPTFVPSAAAVEAERRARQQEQLEEAKRQALRPWPMAFSPSAALATWSNGKCVSFSLEEQDERLHVTLGFDAARRVVEASESPAVLGTLEVAPPPPRKNRLPYAEFGTLGRERLRVVTFQTDAVTRLDVVSLAYPDRGWGVSLVMPTNLFDEVLHALYGFLAAPPHFWRLPA